MLSELLAAIPPLGAARSRLQASARSLLEPPRGAPRVDFEAGGDAGILGPDSVAWKIFAHPAAVFIGGVAAVYLELAEPRVRSGVWDHTEFKVDPIGRMKRTGLAAMVTTYGSRAEVERVTSHVRRMHERVRGVTPEGVAYHASDPELLTWVHVTAVYGFLSAHVRYVNPDLPVEEQDRYYAESVIAARLYGATWAPTSVAEAAEYLESVRPRLVDHAIVHEFHRLVSDVPAISRAALPVQRLLVQAAIDILPSSARDLLGFGGVQWARVAARPLVRSLVSLATMATPDGPPQQACRRVGVDPARLFE